MRDAHSSTQCTALPVLVVHSGPPLSWTAIGPRPSTFPHRVLHSTPPRLPGTSVGERRRAGRFKRCPWGNVGYSGAQWRIGPGGEHLCFSVLTPPGLTRRPG